MVFGGFFNLIYRVFSKMSQLGSYGQRFTNAISCFEPDPNEPYRFHSCITARDEGAATYIMWSIPHCPDDSAIPP
jgi:hypothetical protein